jgi:RNA polymerase sigma factor (sigma-70 family)
LTRSGLSRYGLVVRVVPQPSPGGGPIDTSVDPLLELGRRAGGKDRAATRALVLAVGPAMLRAIRMTLGQSKGEAEDVLQEAVEGLLRALPSFRGACTLLHFACRIGVLTALAWRRRLTVRANLTIDVPDAVDVAAGTGPTPADALLATRRREALGALLDELSPVQAEVLTLHCGLDLSVQEIAASMGCPIETVRSRLRLAKQALRERIGANQDLTDMLELNP